MAKSISTTTFLLHLCLLFIISSLPPAKGTYSIADFGAKPDGQTDSTKAFLSAWSAACGSSGPATIYVPSGRFLIGQAAAFQGPCNSNKVTIQIDGTLLAPSDYGTLGDNDWMAFNNVDGVSIYGGTIDGQGASLWGCKASGRNCPFGARSLVFGNSKNIMISGLTSTNSKLCHIVFNGCQGVTVQAVKIVAPGNSPNTDGIHVSTSSGVTITGAGIKTGDDCISIGPGTTNLWIEKVTCGPGHGISIGSLGKDAVEEGVQNVTVKTTGFSGTDNGLRIKTWGRPSNGFVKGVVFEHSVMQNVKNPIIITQNYCPDSKGCPNEKSGVKISQVAYNDIQGSSATPVAVNFDCSPSNPCSGITLQDIKLTYGGSAPAKSSCNYADGTASGFIIPPSCL